jgi:hypothetical protein
MLFSRNHPSLFSRIFACLFPPFLSATYVYALIPENTASRLLTCVHTVILFSSIFFVSFVLTA